MSPHVEAGTRSAVSRTWWVLAFFAIAIAGYAFSFIVRGEAAFPGNLHESFAARPWGIFPHVVLGGVALILGPFQFRRDLLLRNRALHRRLGVTYVVCAAATGVVGMYMAAYSFGGWVTHLGFGLLGFLTLSTTIVAYLRIRERNVRAHREAMIYSLALLFAAVTLRVELPLLIIAFRGDFTPAYQIVSWLCWVPNLAWAAWYTSRSRATAGANLPAHSRAGSRGS